MASPMVPMASGQQRAIPASRASPMTACLLASFVRTHLDDAATSIAALPRQQSKRRSRSDNRQRQQVGKLQDRRRPRRPSFGLWRHARHRQGHMGRAGGSRGGAAHAASRARARHQPDRHGRQLRPGDQRAADPRGALSRTKVSSSPPRAGFCVPARTRGYRAASPTTCASRCSSACVASASSASTSGNCTASTPACRAPSSSTPSPRCRRKDSSVTWA